MTTSCAPPSRSRLSSRRAAALRGRASGDSFGFKDMNLPASLREPPAPRGGRNNLIMKVTLICNRKQTFGWLSHQGVAPKRLDTTQRPYSPAHFKVVTPQN